MNYQTNEESTAEKEGERNVDKKRQKEKNANIRGLQNLIKNLL